MTPTSCELNFLLNRYRLSHQATSGCTLWTPGRSLPRGGTPVTITLHPRIATVQQDPINQGPPVEAVRRSGTPVDRPQEYNRTDPRLRLTRSLEGVLERFPRRTINSLEETTITNHNCRITNDNCRQPTARLCARWWELAES
jgi:hypothetical protein